MALSLQRYTGANSDSKLYCLLKERVKREQEKLSAIPDVKPVGDDLPENLIIEILSWLPVKDLLKFKSVCKSWYDMISSPHFVSKHLENYYNSNSCDYQCLLAQYYVSHAELQLFQLLVDEIPFVSGYETLFRVPIYCSYACGPCNGIYYLYHTDFDRRAMWNPAINEVRRLPPIIEKPDVPSNLTYASYDVCGFGLHPVTNDYMVVVLKSYWFKTEDEVGEVTHPLSVLLYSLSANSWRYWGDLAHDYFLDNNKTYFCVEGSFYWLGLRTKFDENSEVIVAYDMAADAFQEIRLPDYVKPSSKSLGVYNNSLAFYAVHETENCFDIWTLNEGVWTEKLTIEPRLQVRKHVGHWRDNQVVFELRVGGTLALCDIDSREMWDLGFKGLTSTCQGVYAYKESLVSIKDRNEHEPEEDERRVEHARAYVEEEEEDYFIFELFD